MLMGRKSYGVFCSSFVLLASTLFASLKKLLENNLIGSSFDIHWNIKLVDYDE